MQDKKPNKKRKITPTMKQMAVARTLLENGGKMSVSKAMSQNGYSETMAHNPQKLTRSKGFIAILEKAGVTDKKLAETHNQLMQSSVLMEKEFPGECVVTEITENEDGEPLEKPIKNTEWIVLSDKEIKKIIESIDGCKLVYIKKGIKSKVAYYKAPEDSIRKGAVEMGYKVKNRFAPEQGLVEHSLSDADRAILEKLIIDE